MTTPASTWRHSYINSRLPYSSGTTGQICSAPFVLHKNLKNATNDPDRPFEIANGLLTHASYANIIPIAVPPEYAILETWMVITGSHGFVGSTDTEPVLNLYGRTSFGDNHSGNMPDDYGTITNWPANLREWWSPLFMTDRTTPSSTGTTGGHNTGVTDTDNDQEKGTGSFEMHAFGFEARTIPVPRSNGAITEPAFPVAKIGDGTATEAAHCFPSQTFFLNGADTILTTVTDALAGGGLGSGFLMGRFHG